MFTIIDLATVMSFYTVPDKIHGVRICTSGDYAQNIDYYWEIVELLICTSW
jgi:hypothetical protein